MLTSHSWGPYGSQWTMIESGHVHAVHTGSNAAITEGAE